MISTPTGRSVIVVGGATTYPGNAHHSKSFIELKGDSIGNLKWTVLKQELKVGRKDHVAFPISDKLSKKLCSMKNKF